MSEVFDPVELHQDAAPKVVRPLCSGLRRPTLATYAPERMTELGSWISKIRPTNGVPYLIQKRPTVEGCRLAQSAALALGQIPNDHVLDQEASAG